MQSCVVRNSSRLFERSRLIRRNIPRRGCVCVRRRGVCVFGVGCVYSAADGGACLSRARVRRTTDPTRSIDRRAPTDARARPTPTADPHPAEVRGVHPSYSTRASRRVRAINLFYVPLYTQTSYCARIRPSRVARDGVRADDRGRGHARDATRSRREGRGRVRGRVWSYLLLVTATYCTGWSLEYSVVWTLIRAIGRGRRAAIHVSGGRRRRAGARAVT